MTLQQDRSLEEKRYDLIRKLIDVRPRTVELHFALLTQALGAENTLDTLRLAFEGSADVAHLLDRTPAKSQE